MAFQPNKRGLAADTTPVTKGEFEDLFENFASSFKSDINAEVTTTLKSFESNTTAHLLNRTQELFAAHSTRVNQRCDEVEAAVCELQGSHKALQSETTAIKEQVAALNKAMAIAETAASPQHALDADEWDRPPRLHVIDLKSSDQMARGDVLETIKPWLADAGFSETQWSLAMAPSSLRGSLIFKGEATTAARRAKAANMALRMEDGTWTKLTVPNPTPSSDGQPRPALPLFVSPDASPKTKAQMWMGKKLLNILKAEYPGLSFAFRRSDAMVTVQRKDLAFIAADSREETAPLWKGVTVADHDINKERINTLLSDQSPTHGPQPSAASSGWSF